MPKTEAEGYIDTNAHLRARVAVLEQELAAAQAREVQLREHIGMLGIADPIGQKIISREALALPDDDTILREMIEAARVEGVEEAAKLCDWLNGEKRLTPAGCAAAIRAKIIK